MGGGKTSQLVKTAAQLVIREKKKVAIVTTDTSKVGAVDQLKIYCQILNVPFAIIRDRSEWQWLESQLGSIDHVLSRLPRPWPSRHGRNSKDAFLDAGGRRCVHSSMSFVVDEGI
jgi:signal recognition particle GTPase